MKKKIILMLGPDKGMKGGVSSIIRLYFTSSLSDSYDIHQCVTYMDGRRWQKVLKLLFAIPCFIFQILRWNPKVVHIHSASRSSFYRKSFFIVLAKMFRKKILLHVHGAEFNVFFHEESSESQKGYIRWILRKVDVIAVLSESWKKDFEKIVPDKKTIIVLPNTVAIPSDVEKIKSNEGIDILFMGRLGIRKGVYDLIEAAEVLIKKYPTLQFKLCGDGDIEKVKEVVRLKGLQQNFEIPGWIEDKSKWFCRADIFILPSYNEGVPISILEAGSYGLPIVTTPVGGIQEVIRHEDNGFLFCPGNIMKMADQLEMLISSGELRHQFGSRIRHHIQEKYSQEYGVSKVAQVYERMQG